MRILAILLLISMTVFWGCNDNSASNSISPSLSSTNGTFTPSTVQVIMRSNVKSSRTIQLRAVEWDGSSEFVSGVAYEVGPDKSDLFKAKIAESTPDLIKQSKMKEVPQANSPALASSSDSGDKCYAFVNATLGGITIVTEAQNTSYGDKVHCHYWQWSGGGSGYYYQEDPYGEWSYVETSISRSENYWWCRGVLERWGRDYYVDSDPSPKLASRITLPKPYPDPTDPYDEIDYVMYEKVLAEEEAN